MRTLVSHARAEEIAARLESGEEVSSTDRIHLEEHLESCETCAARHQRLKAFVGLLREQPVQNSDRSDRAMIAEAIMRAGAADKPSLRPAPATQRVFIAAAAALVCGLALAAAIRWGLAGQDPSAEAPATGGSSAAAPQTAVGPKPVKRGVEVSAVEVQDGTTAEEDTGNDAAFDGRAPCRGVRTDAEGSEPFRVLASTRDVCRLAMTTGTLQVAVDPEAKMRVAIDTPTATVRVLGTVFRVSVGPDGTAVAVYRGTVEVGSRAGSRRVKAGKEAVQSARAEGPLVVRQAAPDALRGLASFVGAPEPVPEPARRPRARLQRPAKEQRAPVEDLRAMLSSGQTREARDEALNRDGRPEYAGRQAELQTIVAESYVLEGQHGHALDAYRKVWDGEGRSATAANALMAAAHLSLRQTDGAARAAELYARYARQYPEGSLREQALAGRCRALTKAGQTSQAKTCAQTYFQEYPEGHFGGRLQSLVD